MVENSFNYIELEFQRMMHRASLTQDGEAYAFYDAFIQNAFAICKPKNKDYAKGNVSAHSFMNFEISGNLNSHPTDLSFFNHTSTKVARFVSLFGLMDGGENKNVPNFESVEDTFPDLFNYLLLLVAYCQFWHDHDPKDTYEPLINRDEIDKYRLIDSYRKMMPKVREDNYLYDDSYSPEQVQKYRDFAFIVMEEAYHYDKTGKLSLK